MTNAKKKLRLNKISKPFVVEEAKRLYGMGYSTREIKAMLPVRASHETIAQIVKGMPKKVIVKDLEAEKQRE